MKRKVQQLHTSLFTCMLLRIDCDHKQVFVMKLLVSLLLCKGTEFTDSFILLYGEYDVSL